MIDDADQAFVPSDNIRTLMYLMGLASEERLVSFRKGTVYESVRSSDVRLFVIAGQKPQTISEIARVLSITRQAAQSSVQRLQKLQVVSLQSLPGNKRDKLVVLTPRGQLATKTVLFQIKRFEAELVEVVGAERFEMLRQDLQAMIKAVTNRNTSELSAARPAV